MLISVAKHQERENHIMHLSRGKKKNKFQNLKYITVSTKSALFWYQLTDKKNYNWTTACWEILVCISIYIYWRDRRNERMDGWMDG